METAFVNPGNLAPGEEGYYVDEELLDRCWRSQGLDEPGDGGARCWMSQALPGAGGAR